MSIFSWVFSVRQQTLSTLPEVFIPITNGITLKEQHIVPVDFCNNCLCGSLDNRPLAMIYCIEDDEEYDGGWTVKNYGTTTDSINSTYIFYWEVFKDHKHVPLLHGQIIGDQDEVWFLSQFVENTQTNHIKEDKLCFGVKWDIDRAESLIDFPQIYLQLNSYTMYFISPTSLTNNDEGRVSTKVMSVVSYEDGITKETCISDEIYIKKGDIRDIIDGKFTFRWKDNIFYIELEYQDGATIMTS